MVHSSAPLIAAALSETGALRLSPRKPFRWASGIQAPVYCDNRITLSFPKIRTLIKNALSEHVRAFFPNAEAIAGVATAGIPQGVLVADVLQLPFAYVRSSPKDHGAEKLIEGSTQPNTKTVVVEDLVSTAGSALKASEALKNAGVDVIGMAAVFSYELKSAEKRLQAAGIPFIYLCGYSDLVQEASRKALFSDEELRILEQWHKNPENFYTDYQSFT